ncbi:hypothetical protein GLOIN_2v1791382 [Rhizophagus clarus]|uniref:Uncharacterized protein n=1 Tax=Rhizophagus clarus TaxID=94130 RepID=A0A8H3M9Y7_9GLOM|nr:hypothetical protein GLOIN_2v1791382 [Rhizophagus clarus]
MILKRINKIRELTSIKQGTEELVESNIGRINKLIKRVAPRVNDSAERFEVTHFINGLISYLISRVFQGNSTTFENAITAAKVIKSGSRIQYQAILEQVGHISPECPKIRKNTREMNYIDNSYKYYNKANNYETNYIKEYDKEKYYNEEKLYKLNYVSAKTKQIAKLTDKTELQNQLQN